MAEIVMIITATQYAGEEEFKQVFPATSSRRDDRKTQIEDRFNVVADGHLTFRRGELHYFHFNWRGQDRKSIQIPGHHPYGCLYSQERPEEVAQNNDITTARDIALTTGWFVASVESVRDQLIADRLIDGDGPTGRDIIYRTPRGSHTVQTLSDMRGVEING